MNLVEIIKKKGNKWCLYSKTTGKNLGCYSSKAKAENRERQVNYFKSREDISDNELIRFLKILG